MTKELIRKLRKFTHGYLIVQIPSKIQYKHDLTENDTATIIDGDDEIVIRIRKKGRTKKDHWVSSNGESNNTTTDQGDGVVLA